MTTPAQFQQHAADGFTLVPVVREVLSDLDTPLSVYLKLADGPHTYLFESVEGGERFGRYSIIGLPARRVYEFRGHALEIREHGEVVETREVEDPLAEVERLRTLHKVPKLDGLPGFTGGLVGWFGFECIEYIEPRLRADQNLFTANSYLGTQVTVQDENGDSLTGLVTGVDCSGDEPLLQVGGQYFAIGSIQRVQLPPTTTTTGS